MYSHIIFFLTLYFVLIFYPTKTLQYQPYHRFNQFGPRQNGKPYSSNKFGSNPVNLQQNTRVSSYLLPHSRELHSVHASFDEDRLESVRDLERKYCNGPKRLASQRSFKTPLHAGVPGLVQTKNYRRDAKVVDYPDFMNKEGIIPYYQSKLGPSSFRLKRNTDVANVTKEAQEMLTEAASEALVKSLEDSFANPKLTKDDLEVSFVPHIRVKRDDNQ